MASRITPRSSLAYMFGQNDHVHHEILIISSLKDSVVCTIFLCTLGSCQGHSSAHFNQHADRVYNASTSPTKNHALSGAESNLGSRT